MHPKPKMTDDRGVKHEETAELWEEVDELAIARIWTLPLRLLQNLANFGTAAAGDCRERGLPND